MIQKAFGDNAINAVQIKVWHKHFKDGWESAESDSCSGRPATSRTPENGEHVQAAVNKDQPLTGRELEGDPGIPGTTVSEILTQNPGVKCVVAKFIPQLLLPEQKEYHAAVTNDLIQTITNEPDFLKKVITLKGTEASLSYIQCLLYLQQISLISHGTWTYTFWTHLVYCHNSSLTISM